MTVPDFGRRRIGGEKPVPCWSRGLRTNDSSEEFGQSRFIHHGDREAVVPELAECYKVPALNAFNNLSM